MNMQLLIDTAKELLADNKGLLAMAESNSTCDQRFALLDIPQREANYRTSNTSGL